LNELIYVKNGKVYFTVETTDLAQKYNITITKNKFPDYKPLIIHGIIPLNEFMYKLKVDYQLKQYEVKRFEDSVLYYAK